jgi:hypothetical protein
MNAIRILIILSIVGIIGSGGATYSYMIDVNQSEIASVEQYYSIQMDNSESYIDELEIQTSILQKNLFDTQEELQQINQSLIENLSELHSLQSGDKYSLNDPTYTEVSRFIGRENTDEIPYDNESFDCEHFSQLINNHAEEQGIRCAYVVLYFYNADAGHAIIAFNTSNQGMVYIEPQSDEWVKNLEIGNEYWTECITPKGNYYYEDAPNDTIREILVFW